MTLKVKGLKEIKAMIRKSAEEIQGALAAAIYEEGLALDDRSVRLVPVDTGRLRASHFVAPPSATSEGPTCEVGYGTVYALRQHEELDWQHTVGQANYLGQPMLERQAGYTERVAKRTWSNFEAGVDMPIIDPTTPTAPGNGTQEGNK